jgi:hypothetical protein
MTVGTTVLVSYAVAIVLALVPGVLFGQSTEQAPPLQRIATLPVEDQVLPPFSAVLLDGKAYSTESMKGRAAVLLLWTAECPASQAMREQIMETWRHAQAAGGAFYVANATEDADTSRAALAGVSPSIVIQIAPVLDRFYNMDVYEQLGEGVQKAILTPAVVILDSEGVVKHSGPWDGIESTIRLLRQVGPQLQQVAGS